MQAARDHCDDLRRDLKHKAEVSAAALRSPVALAAQHRVFFILPFYAG